jgi:hypothetical protein
VTVEDKSAVRQVLREKFAAIDRMDEIDVPPLEPALADVLSFVQAHPEAVDEVKAEFLEQLTLLRGDSWWAIAYCMHALRWPEIREEVARQFAFLVEFRDRMSRDEQRHARETLPRYTTELRRWNVLWHILESFEPDWRDRDFFVAYDPGDSA